MDEKILMVLRTKIRTQLNGLTDNIAGGSAKDFGEYRYACGVIHGLALAERELLDLIEVAKRNDN
jgi:hypothetical protein